MTYAAYLSSPAWKRKRARVLRRDNHRCQVCLSRDRLEVHHKRYPRRWGEEDSADLITLCASCHEAISHKDDWLVRVALLLGRLIP